MNYVITTSLICVHYVIRRGRNNVIFLTRWYKRSKVSTRKIFATKGLQIRWPSTLGEEAVGRLDCLRVVEGEGTVVEGGRPFPAAGMVAGEVVRMAASLAVVAEVAEAVKQ